MGGAWSYVIAAFTGDWTLAVLIAALLATGALLFRYGRMEITSPDRSPMSYRQQTWLNRLAFWGALTPETSDEERQRLARQHIMMMGYVIVGVSLGAFVVSIALIGLILALGSAEALTRPGLDVFNAVFFPGVIITSTLGYLVGIRVSLRGVPSDQPRGETRSLRDYCSAWLWTLPLAVSTLAAALILHASIGASSMIVEWFSKPVRLPAQMVGGAVAALIISEMLIPVLCAQRIAVSPNVIIATDPLVTQRASDCLRAFGAGIPIFMLWPECSAMLPNIDLLRSALGFPPISGALGMLQGALSIVGILMIFGYIALLLSYLSGRMGGRLTGWWWQRRPRPGPYEQAVTAQERE